MSETNDDQWQVRGGFVISGIFETEREKQLAQAANREWAALIAKRSDEAYQRGYEDGKLFRPRTWLGRLFG